MENIKEEKLIFTCELARALLKRGYRIIDIKANKYDPKATVFIFQNEEGLSSTIYELTH